MTWPGPMLSQSSVDAVVFYFRKSGHLTEYAVLALFCWYALRRTVRRDPRPWSWRLARLSVALCALYAATDEFHQSFVPTREARVHDVIIDTIGATAGMLLLWLLGRWRKMWCRDRCRRVCRWWTWLQPVFGMSGVMGGSGFSCFFGMFLHFLDRSGAIWMTPTTGRLWVMSTAPEKLPAHENRSGWRPA